MTQEPIEVHRRDVPESLQGVAHRWFTYRGAHYGIVYRGASLGYDIVAEDGARVAGGYHSQTDLVAAAPSVLDAARPPQ